MGLSTTPAITFSTPLERSRLTPSTATNFGTGVERMSAIALSQVLVPRGVVDCQRHQDFRFGCSRLVSRLDDRVGIVKTQRAPLLHRYGDQDVRLLHAAKFIGGNHHRNRLAEHAERRQLCVWSLRELQPGGRRESGRLPCLSQLPRECSATVRHRRRWHPCAGPG